MVRFPQSSARKVHLLRVMTECLTKTSRLYDSSGEMGAGAELLTRFIKQY